MSPYSGVTCRSIITMHGDHFGTIVDLAGRLSDHAVPAEVLVTEGVTRELGDRRSPPDGEC